MTSGNTAMSPQQSYDQSRGLRRQPMVRVNVVVRMGPSHATPSVYVSFGVHRPAMPAGELGHLDDPFDQSNHAGKGGLRPLPFH